MLHQCSVVELLRSVMFPGYILEDKLDQTR